MYLNYIGAWHQVGHVGCPFLLWRCYLPDQKARAIGDLYGIWRFYRCIIGNWHVDNTCCRVRINDQVGKTPLLIALENDSLTFHAWNRLADGKALTFKLEKGQLTDNETASVWDWDGLCTAGVYKGRHLSKIQAYQEYWHSWKHFHPATLYW